MTAPALFIAYSSRPPEIGRTIEAAAHLLAERPGSPPLRTWAETDVAGQFISTRVLESIDEAASLVADISTPNFNVAFEIGFAIAHQKNLLLIRHEPLAAQAPTLSEVGLFDTLGYVGYQNSDELSELLRTRVPTTPLLLPTMPLNRKAPVYLVESRYKTDAVTRIISRVKKAGLRFRSFDPNEQPRLSAFEALPQVFQSYGILLHLLPSRIADCLPHNLRAAFLAGLAYGFDKVLLVLQEGDEPVPVDYRDLTRAFFNFTNIDEAIADFAASVTEAFQAADADRVQLPASFLATLTLGSSSAENEFTTLRDYYLRTDAFQRARRGEVRLVDGRKGSGKSALFFQLRDDLRQHGSYVVLDLKPDGYQLLKFKDSVLSALEPGSLNHTIAAFWEYLLWLEICRKLLEKDQQRHLRDSRLLAPYRRLAQAYETDEYIAEGDFSERMSELMQHVRDDFNVKFREGGSGRLSQPQITELLYRHDVARLRQDVISYLKFKDALWLLFDNIDKGWPPNGLKPEDLVIIKTLLDATRKIERELTRTEIQGHTVVFLRSDVYDLLVQETPDRGKESRLTVDWTDADLLRELIRLRIVHNGLPTEQAFADVWPRICISHIEGEESSQFLVDRSVMRPRALLDLVNHCKSCAVNLGHARIEADDVRKGLRLYSKDLITDIGLEIRDVFPEAENALYSLIDTAPRLDQAQLVSYFADLALTSNHMSRLIDLLLWYGVLGAVREDGDVDYIYSVSYDFRLLKARLARMGSNSMYEINPAFRTGLGTQDSGI